MRKCLAVALIVLSFPAAATACDVTEAPRCGTMKRMADPYLFPGYPYAPEYRTGGDIIDVGDSHTFFGGGGRQYPKWDTFSSPGRGSYEAYAILSQQLKPRHDTVVFDIATNDRLDPASFRYNLNRVWKLIGPDRKLILVTSYYTNFYTLAVNSQIYDFKATKPNGRVKVVKWAEHVYDNPGVIADAAGEGIWPDGVHFTPNGYRTRNSMVKDLAN